MFLFALLCFQSHTIQNNRLVKITPHSFSRGIARRKILYRFRIVLSNLTTQVMQCDLLITRTRCHWRFNPLLDAGNFRSKHFLKSFRIILSYVAVFQLRILLLLERTRNILPTHVTHGTIAQETRQKGCNSKPFVPSHKAFALSQRRNKRLDCIPYPASASAKVASRGTKCHGVRDEHLCKIASRYAP